ncbi:MAG: APC family permease, partial [Terriglobia bacterium]
RHPARDLPRALLFGTLILAAVYLTASSAYYSALTVQEVAGAERVAADAVTRLLGPAAGGAIAGLILVSIFGSINGSIMTSTRCYYQMAADGLFLPAFARLHPRTQVPIVAIVVQGLWGSLLAVLGTFQQLFTAVIFTSWISYAAAVAAVIVLRRTEPETPRPYRVPGYPWLPALFVVAALGIVASAVWSQPWHVGLAFALILSGLPVYRFLLGKKKGATDEH